MYSYIDLEHFCISCSVSHENGDLYCLSDHAGIPGLSEQLKLNDVDFRNLFAGSREENALLVAPLLFSLREQVEKKNRSFLRWLSERGTYTSSLLFLSTPLSMDELAHRLSRRLDARISENMNVLLRFFDPRIFEALTSVLSIESKRKFLGAADEWWYLDRAGKTQYEKSDFSLKEDLNFPWEITSSEEFSLIAASEIDQVIASTDELVSDLLLKIPKPVRFEMISRLSDRATELGIAAIVDKALYCALALTHGEDFADRGEWKEVIGMVREGVALGDAIIVSEETLS